MCQRKMAMAEVAEDIPDLLRILSDLKDQLSKVSGHVKSLDQHSSCSEFNTDQGISFLELKHQLLLSYLGNLVQVVLLKCSGASLCSADSVHRIVEIRTVLEKIRPLDQKLHYQVDKLVRTASTGLTISANDPLRFKPQPGNLVSKTVDNDDENESGFPSSVEPEVYVPPRIVAVPYSEQVRQKPYYPPTDKSLLEELRDELTDSPIEFKISASSMRMQQDVDQERTISRFEEANLLRLPRKRKKSDLGRTSQQQLDDITEFAADNQQKKKRIKVKKASRKKRRH